MPAWKHKLDRALIHAIMGYFISLFHEEDDGLTEG
jgi:hypothetical protein